MYFAVFQRGGGGGVGWGCSMGTRKGGANLETFGSFFLCCVGSSVEQGSTRVPPFGMFLQSDSPTPAQVLNPLPFAREREGAPKAASPSLRISFQSLLVPVTLVGAHSASS